jgi:hypothetical protein
MKELTIEEKAEAYDKAIERARKLYNSEETSAEVEIACENIFPELIDNKMEWIEKIRQELKTYLEHREVKQISESDAKHQWIAWLEKQDNNINCIYDKELSELLHIVICRYVNDPNISYSERENVSKKIFPYVGLLEKQGEQKPAETEKGTNGNNREIPFSEQKPAWSEEDEKMLNDILMCGEHHCYLDAGNIAWLKSLRHQKQWKPSDEQMEALYDSIPENVMEISEREMLLNELYKNLKKL